MCTRLGLVQYSVVASRRSISKPHTSQESGVVGHADERVIVHHAYGDPLASAQHARPSRVAGVELALACLDAAGAAQERRGVHHHLVAGNVSEVEVVHFYLTIYEVDPIQEDLQLSRARVHPKDPVVHGHDLPVPEDSLRQILPHLNG